MSDRESDHCAAGLLDERIIIAGSGGQGVLTLGKTLCILLMRAGKNVTYMPSYGTEVRGGTCHCHVQLADRTIYSPQVERATGLVLMNAPSYERFRVFRAEEGVLFLNSSLVTPLPEDAARTVCVPASEIADELGDMRVANMALLGALNVCRNLVPVDRIEALINEVLGARPKLAQMNVTALARGIEIAQGVRS